MKTNREKELDNLFRQGLENPARETNFREDDWDAMEALLDQGKKRNIIAFWRPILGSVAALLILALGWFFIQNKHQDQGTVAKINVTSRSAHDDKRATTQRKEAATNQQNNSIVVADNTNDQAGTSNSRGVISRQTGSTTQFNNLRVSKSLRNIYAYDRSAIKSNIADPDNLSLNNNILASTIPAIELPDMNSDLSNDKLPPADQIVKPSFEKIKPKIKANNNFRPNLAITVLASPDINGANTFQNSKVGTNVGLLFSIGVSKRLTISTGASYSVKPYMTDFGNYHTNFKFATNPDNVSANCKVLDIPLNADYLFYNRSGNKLSLGTGLSSYFMLRENYHYNYESAGTVGPTDYNIANRNKYLFGVLNLNATYQRQISSKFSLNIQPYFKVPLTNIGYGQVKLQSTGLAVGVSWNVGSFLKH